jgi:energy-coupling factor transporter ATP-binding protein EcfA2
MAVGSSPEIAEASSTVSTLDWRNLSCRKGSKVILSDVSGSLEAGQTLAGWSPAEVRVTLKTLTSRRPVLGPSGAGKSTFLDVLSCRFNGAAGQVPLAHLVFSLTGLTLETDRFSSTVLRSSTCAKLPPTLNKTMHCWASSPCAKPSASLHVSGTFNRTPWRICPIWLKCSPSTPLSLPPNAQIDKNVDDTLRVLGLTSVANNKIGTPLQRGISGGQKRRVTLACAFVCHPPILFLDEPTSGLDSETSKEVVSASSSGPAVLELRAMF